MIAFAFIFRKAGGPTRERHHWTCSGQIPVVSVRPAIYAVVPNRDYLPEYRIERVEAVHQLSHCFMKVRAMVWHVAI